MHTEIGSPKLQCGLFDACGARLAGIVKGAGPAMFEPADPLDAALRLAGALQCHHLSYAIGGALAYGLWGIPRATIDVDVNVFLTDSEFPRLFSALRSLSIPVDEEAAADSNAKEGMFSVAFGLYRIDIFTPSIDFAWEAERTKVSQRIEGQEIFFLSAESVAVFKLLLFRAKDLVDLQRLLAVQGARLDSRYIRQQIVELLGDDDERVSKWDELVADSPGA